MSTCKSDSKPKVLIPAAGFGTRVGSPEAKEVLTGPQGSPLIQFALDQALKRHWPVHVITRPEKKSLIDYLKSYRERTLLELEIQLIEPSSEWPDTLLQSEDHWSKRNLLVLPDTVYKPEEIWDSLLASQKPLAVAVFDPPDFSKWGVFQSSPEGRVAICEKPQDRRPGMRAWGLIAFDRAAGARLFKSQLQSTFDHQWKELSLDVDFFELHFFEDVTRSRQGHF